MSAVQSLDLAFAPVYRQRAWAGNQTLNAEGRVYAITEIKASAAAASIRYIALDGTEVLRTTETGRIILHVPLFAREITLPVQVTEVQGYEVHA